MGFKFVYIGEGARVFYKSLFARFKTKKYPGNATDICHQIVEDCWNGQYFQTSTGHFNQFWTRDFGWCVSSLMTLGYKAQIHKTLRYALHRYKKAGKITTTITPNGKPFDYPNMAVDSLPWFIHSIKVSNFPYYDHREFLNSQIMKYYYKVIDKETGLVNPNARFSSMKDLSKRQSSCYDNSMVGMLVRNISEMNLINPFKKYNYPKLLKQYFWNGSYFYDDLKEKDYVAGDANIFPFLLGLVNDREMLKSSIKKIKKEGLDDPLPLKYTKSRKDISFIWEEMLNYNYESDALWQHMGPLYVKLLSTVHPKMAKKLKEKYAQVIEHHCNFLEVFDSEGNPHSTPFYYCDSGMLWAANFLTI